MELIDDCQNPKKAQPYAFTSGSTSLLNQSKQYHVLSVSNNAFLDLVDLSMQ